MASAIFGGMSPSFKFTALLAIGLLPLHGYATAKQAPTADNTTGFAPCDALVQAGLGDRLLMATDPEYDPRIASWWSMNSRLRPWCLVQPHDAQEVSTAMTALLGAGDGAGDWHIAVRSGGHSLGHMNNIDTGVTIDLGRLDQVTYDPNTNIARIGPGGKWRDVYAELHKHGVLTTGGRDGDVGVGGFLLGGGLTYFVGQQSFACDSVRNFEVVLTNGTIVDANQHQHSDLWKALKGGGSNFGIVTRFDMETLPDKDLAYGMRLMSTNHASEFVDAVVHFIDHYQEFDSDALIPFLMHDTTSLPADVVAAAIHVNTEGIHHSRGFDKLRQIPALVPDETSTVSLAQAAAGSEVSSGNWSAQATLSFKNDRRILTRAIELNRRYVQDLAHTLGADNFQTMVFFQPLPKFLSDISDRKGGNMLGLDCQEHNAIIWTGYAAAKTQHDQAIAQTRMNAMVAELQSFAASVDGENPLIYLNYADPSQDALGSYGKKNADFIKRVAAKYDPTRAFQTRVPGGFKISRVDV